MLITDYNQVEFLIYQLARYSKRMEPRIVRPRGNPKELTDKLSKYLGGDECFICSRPETELHHIDGNWKSYIVENLVFVCEKCHFQLHEGRWSNKPIKISSEIIMRKIENITKIKTEAKTRTINGKKVTAHFAPEGTWVNKSGSVTETGLEMHYYVKQIISTGRTISDACRELSTAYGVSDTALKSAYGIICKRIDKIGQDAGMRNTAVNRQMTLAEAIDLRNWCRENNITLI